MRIPDNTATKIVGEIKSVISALSPEKQYELKEFIEEMLANGPDELMSTGENVLVLRNNEEVVNT